VGRTRGRRENFLIFLLGITLIVIAAGVLWYLLMQPRKLAQQASAPAVPSTPLPAPQPSPTAIASPSVAPSPTAVPSPAVAPSPTATQAAASVHEPETIAVRGGPFAMGSNDDPSEKPIHQVTIKPFSIGKYPVTVQQWNECAATKGCGFT